MPIIRVEMLKGRTVEQKRALAEKLTDSFIEACGGNKASINVLISDVEAEDWAIGAQLLSDPPAI